MLYAMLTLEGRRAMWSRWQHGRSRDPWSLPAPSTVLMLSWWRPVLSQPAEMTRALVLMTPTHRARRVCLQSNK